MNRQKVIDALNAYCDECNLCDHCKIGDSAFFHYCRNNDFEKMHDEDLKIYAHIAEIEILEEDPVNRPSHYTQGGIECIDAIAASMTPTEYAGFLKGQVLKYLWRYRLKGKPIEDLKKAGYYLDRLIQITEREEEKKND